jgi:hypothetical protein
MTNDIDVMNVLCLEGNHHPRMRIISDSHAIKRHPTQQAIIIATNLPVSKSCLSLAHSMVQMQK